MKPASPVAALTLFERRSFWPQFALLALVAFGEFLACLYDSVPIFITSALAGYFGLTELGRWSFKTNVLVCSAFAVAGSMFGSFSWIDTVSIFFLLLIAAGFMMYYRDTCSQKLKQMENFALALARENNLAGTAAAAYDKISEAAGGFCVFIVLRDAGGGLCLCAGDGASSRALRRRSSSVWRTFLSGRPYMTGRADAQKDMPLCPDARSVMSLPIEAGGARLGVLQIESVRNEAFFGDDVKAVEIAAFVLGQALFPYMRDMAEPAEIVK